jgi:mycoredoxin
MSEAAVTVHWRPGCPYCTALLRRLPRAGLAFDRIDIRTDPAAAAWVRSVAEGNETVPTVHVRGEDGVTEEALVNPSVAAVLAAVARLAPSALPPSDAPRPPMLRLVGSGRDLLRRLGRVRAARHRG